MKLTQGLSHDSTTGYFEIKALSATVAPVAPVGSASAIPVPVAPAASPISSNEAFSTSHVTSPRIGSVFSLLTSSTTTPFSSPPSPSTLSPQESTSSPSIAASSKETPQSPSSSLSSGAKAGIAVGVIIGVILIAAGGYFIGKRGRYQRAIADDDAPVNENTVFGVGLQDNQARREIDGEHVNRPELHGQQAPTAELPTWTGEAEEKA